MPLSLQHKLLIIILQLIPSSFVLTFLLYPTHNNHRTTSIPIQQQQQRFQSISFGTINIIKRMSSSSLEEDAIDFNNIVSQAVDLSNAYVRNDILTVTRSVRDIDTNMKRQFLYQVPLSHPEIKLPPTEVSSADILHRVPSQSGNKVAILRQIISKDNNTKQHWLEIWMECGFKLQHRIQLPTLVNTDWNFGFGGLEWNLNEDAIVYVGKKNEDKSYSTFFERSNDDDNMVVVGDKFTFGKGIKNDYGELYTLENSYPTLYFIRLDNNKNNVEVSEITNVPENAALGQVQFTPCGMNVIYTAWEHIGGRKLGITYCQQRPCKLYISSIGHLLGDKTIPASTLPPKCLTPDSKVSFSPRITPQKLIFLSSIKGFDTHIGCLELHSMNFQTEKESSEYDVVDMNSSKVIIHTVEANTNEISSFPGLFTTHLPKECFSFNKEYLYLNTFWKCMNRILQVNLKDGTCEPLNNDLKVDPLLFESDTLLCTTKDGLVFSRSTPIKPHMIQFVSTSSGGRTTMTSTSRLDITHPIAISSFSSLDSISTNILLDNFIRYKVYSSPVPSILLLPKIKDDQISSSPLPLIVVPHGGPHSVLTTQFLPSYSYLCASGKYAILLVNFRGSIGYGSSFLNELPGNIGKYDVQDVFNATKQILEEHGDSIDANRVGICGGSHGGFLAAHCIGQYPDIYKVAALRNPVTDIPSMVASTDIPDWCFVESLGINTYPIHNPSTTFQPTKEQICTMYDQSPIAYIDYVRAPTLLALGGNDKRVPMRCQGLEYYYRLKSRGVDCKCLIYEEDGHPLDNPVTESDHWVNVKRWFDQYLI